MSTQNTATDSPSSTPNDAVSLIDNLPKVDEWVPTSLKPLWNMIDQTPLLAGLIVVVLFFFMALVVRYALGVYIQRHSSSAQSVIDNSITEDVKKPLFISIMFLGLAFGINTSQLPNGTETLINLSISIIIASWMHCIFTLSAKVLHKLGRIHYKFPLVEPRTIPLLDLTIKLLTLLVGGYALLLIWGINPVGWLASAGIIGIAVGFAAKDTLANIFSGFFILIDAPYKVGDYVNLDSGERGCVTHIGLRSTRLLSREDIEITLPNALIANAKIVNESGGKNKNIRISLSVGVAYGSDADQVCALLQQIGNEHEEVCDDPIPRVRMRAFGASSLDFDLLVWIENPEDRGRIKHQLLISVYKALQEHSIEIPYTKTDIYIKELPDGGNTSD